MGLSLKGPPKQGSAEMDEGDLTRAVVATYAMEDGLDGQAEAAKVLPARRALWRLVEATAPHLLAAALRARLDRADQTGRGGVRELRRALADWLDPPPTCGRCGRAMSPDLMADPATAVCSRPPPHKVPRPFRRTAAGRSYVAAVKMTPAVCSPPRGPRAAYGTAARPGPLRAAGVARCGTLALFSPLVLDPACAASVKLMKHGGGLAYDLVVDRDARILMSVTEEDVHHAVMGTRAGRAGPHADHRIAEADVLPDVEWSTNGHLRRISYEHDSAGGTGHQVHAFHGSASSISAARHWLDHCLDRACRANGRLVLATQVRYFAPKGTVTRADLVQAGMMGLRRALLDYDPSFTPAGKKSGVRISSYAINWIHQSMGEIFVDRDLVSAPPWATSLRGKVEALGLHAGDLLAHILAVAESRSVTGDVVDLVAVALARMVLAVLVELPLDPVDTGDECGEGFKKPKAGPLSQVAMCVDEVHPCMSVLVSPFLGAALVGDDEAGVAEARGGDLGPALARTAVDAVHAHHSTTFADIEAVHALHASTAARLAATAVRTTPKSKRPVTDERSREQVAAEVARLLGLECTGGALLTALRHGGPPVFVPVSIGGERDDADGGGDSPGSGGGGGSHGLEHLHARPDGEDEEDAALEEEDDRRRMVALLGALEALRQTDPEAAEVVRRRHGLEGGDADEETFEEVGELLRSTGRSLCREAARVAYARGVKAMRKHAAAAGLAVDLPDLGEGSDDAPVTRRRLASRSVWRPIRPAEVRTMVAAPLLLVDGTRNDSEPLDPESWTPAALVF